MNEKLMKQDIVILPLLATIDWLGEMPGMIWIGEVFNFLISPESSTICIESISVLARGESGERIKLL